MSETSRPLSPHLQIYRPQLTSILSIMHRGTGVVLSIGTLALAAWLIAVASGEEAFIQAHLWLSSWLGQLALLGLSFSLFYHLCNGIRHLFWDAGIGLEINQAYASGRAVVVISAGLTVAAWVGAYAMEGG